MPELDAYLPGLRPPLEAQLIDLADEVAYNTADLDDAWSAGLIAAEDVAEAVPQYREIHEAVETQFPGATERERFHEALRQLVDAAGVRPDRGHGRPRAEASGAGEFRGRAGTSGRGWPQFTPEAAETSRDAEAVPVRPGLRLGRRWAATGSSSMARDRRTVSLFPGRSRIACRSLMPSRRADEPAHRVVCDYIAGMTDGFFHRTYEAGTDSGRGG